MRAATGVTTFGGMTFCPLLGGDSPALMFFPNPASPRRLSVCLQLDPVELVASTT